MGVTVTSPGLATVPMMGPPRSIIGGSPLKPLAPLVDGAVPVFPADGAVVPSVELVRRLGASAALEVVVVLGCAPAHERPRSAWGRTKPRSRPRRDPWLPTAAHAVTDTVTARGVPGAVVAALAAGGPRLDTITVDRVRRLSAPVRAELRARPTGRGTFLAIDLLPPNDGGPGRPPIVGRRCGPPGAAASLSPVRVSSS